MKNGDINRLWIWGRRQNSIARFEHGGYNASFPINDHTVLAQIFYMKAAEEAEKDAQSRILKRGPRPSNILQFAPPRGANKAQAIRRKNKASARLSSRSNPKSTIEKPSKKD